MSLIDLLPHPFTHTAPEKVVPPALEIDLPPFGNEDIEFMPQDTRSAHVAALAVTKYGEQIKQDHEIPNDAEIRTVPDLSSALIQQGVEAANAYESPRGQKRYEEVAATHALHGVEAAVTIYALSKLAQKRDKTVSPFDVSTAQIMLSSVDHESRVIHA